MCRSIVKETLLWWWKNGGVGLNSEGVLLEIIRYAGLSTLFEVGGPLTRVGGEIDYFCIGLLSTIYEIVKK